MKFRLYLSSLLLLLSLSASAAETGEAHALLMKMEKAARSLNYEGIFVYHHGRQLETMRIMHRVDNGEVRERLVSLNGAAREIIRTDREVLCYLPEENSVVIEHRRADNKAFPSIVPEQLSELDKHYSIELGQGGRVADRSTQHIVIKPKDGYRYGYELWPDKQTGLVLRADLVDDEGMTVEQFMFTAIRPGAKISDKELRPRYTNKKTMWLRENGKNLQNEAQDWTATNVPPGFTLSTRITRRMPTREQPVQHLVYSDGLSAVSVFVERLGEDAKAAPAGTNRMGAINAFVKVVDNHQITVVGEVPAVTVDMIGQSVKALSGAEQ